MHIIHKEFSSWKYIVYRTNHLLYLIPACYFFSELFEIYSEGSRYPLLLCNFVLVTMGQTLWFINFFVFS